MPLYEQRFQIAEEQKIDHPYLISALVNGARGVVFTAIATLFTKGHLKLLEKSEPAFLGLTQKKSQRLVRGDQPARDALEIEHVLYAAADEEGEVKLQQIIEAGLPLGEAYRDQLREVGLVEPDASQHWSYRITPSLLMGGILLVGLIKLAVGLSRNRPVGFLVFLLLVTGVLTAYFLFSKRYLTPSGRKLSRQLVKQNQNLRTSSASTEQLSLADVAMTTAVLVLRGGKCTMAAWQTSTA